MPFVTDSRLAGYLGPITPKPNPAEDDNWEDFLHGIFAGVTGLDPTLVRPRWQPEPPLRPDINVNWMAFGTQNTRVDFTPAIYHLANGISGGNGYDALQEHEEMDILCSFYGPNNEYYQSLCRRGLMIDQNRAVLRANAVGLVETTGFTRAAELIFDVWWQRTDMTVTLRREIRYNYNIMNLLAADVKIVGNPPGYSDRVITDDTHIGTPAPVPGTNWDEGGTAWDGGATNWDVAP